MSAAWASRFLFAPSSSAARRQVSGGERGCAHREAELGPADVLLLDEPTTIWTSRRWDSRRELLEFSGALVLVTHAGLCCTQQDLATW